jgi:MFS family permease
MYLAFLVPQHVEGLTDQAITILGGLPFVGNLGLASIFIFALNALFKNDKHFEFVVLTFLGFFSISLAWGLLLIVFYAPSISFTAQVVCLVVSLLASGNGITLFFSGWLGKALPLVNPQYKFVYGALGNASFAGGSIVSLALKLFLDTKPWMIMMFTFQSAVCGIAVVVAYYCFRFIIDASVEDNEPELSLQSTKNVKVISTNQLLLSLFACRKPGSGGSSVPLLNVTEDNSERKNNIAADDEVLTPRLFYLLLCTSALLLALGTTFIANLGLLVKEESSDTDDDFDKGDDDMSNSFKHQVLVFLWSSVGQTITRLLLPFISFWRSKYCIDKAMKENSVSDLKELEMSLQKWTNLYYSLSIAVVFFVFLLLLRYSSSAVPFIVASAIISGAYGSTWVVVSAYPSFFGENSNFAVVLSVLQFFGMFGLIFLLLLIALLELNNDGVFVVLMILSIVTVIVVLLTMMEFHRNQRNKSRF